MVWKREWAAISADPEEVRVFSPHGEELIGKMERYNAIRHDETVSEKRKEAIREKLFEGDHAWPHL